MRWYGGARRPAEPQRKKQFEGKSKVRTKLMMMAAAVAVAFGVWAETETVGNHTWTYRINGGGAEIYGTYRSGIIPCNETDSHRHA